MEQSISSQLPAVVPHRWMAIAAVSAAIAVIIYVLAVWTVPGQMLENAALRGADKANASSAEAASRILNQITVYSLAFMVAAVAFIGLLRRRLDLTVAAVGVIVGTQIVVQILKRYVLPRPELVDVSGPYTHNSFPSGHTAIAMTVLFATVIVVPYRWRGPAMVVVATWAVGIAHNTLIAKWHRLSDTLGADAIALAAACLASWWLARRGSLVRNEGRRKLIPTLLTMYLSIMALATVALGVIVWTGPLAQENLAAVVREDSWVVYLGATSFASAGSLVAALIFLAMWRRVDTVRAATTDSTQCAPREREKAGLPG
ncbi:phosphatase PAP2 family protein [Nocardia terrae]|uniref:phosphatase PAP2 family protein n=1 Tax=Nocardia terrae TaxID=2675851 RepID=UPI002E258715